MLDIFKELLKDADIYMSIEPWPDREYFIFNIGRSHIENDEQIIKYTKPVFISMRSLEVEPEACKTLLLNRIKEVLDEENISNCGYAE